MTTEDDLKDAFAGESRANRRYLAFAEQALRDGFPQVARLFRAAAAGEAVHADVFLRMMNAVRATPENLEEALGGESFEFKDMYPRYEATAMEEGDGAAVAAFQNAMAVEEVHHNLLMDALDRVRVGEDLPPEEMLVCQVCGNVAAGERPRTCPVCSAPAEAYEQIV
jgi:rubrerythrin